jgi:hypothetical protein
MGEVSWAWTLFGLPLALQALLSSETHVLGGTPISNIDRIGQRLLDDLAAARSEVEAEEILYCYQIGSVLSFVETVVLGAGLVGGWDSRWSESFCIPESVHLAWSISAPSSHWPWDTDPLWDIAIQHRILILLGLLYVPLVVSSTVILSVSRPLVTVGFRPSEQVLSRVFSPCRGGEGARGKSEKDWRKRDKTWGWLDRAGRREERIEERIEERGKDRGREERIEER